MAMTRREFLGNSLAVGTMSLVSHLDPARRLRGRASESDVLAFTHVTVIDATGRPALPEQTVLVKGDRICGRTWRHGPRPPMPAGKSAN
jgi:hypothetical protein